MHWPHHNAPYLSIRVVYRNNFFYYLFIPGLWLSGALTNYKGNYGNLLFFWDVLFGTAKITRQYPEEFGVENLPEPSVVEQLVWPLVSAPRPQEQTEEV